jgi:hypothetical protein
MTCGRSILDHLDDGGLQTHPTSSRKNVKNNALAAKGRFLSVGALTSEYCSAHGCTKQHVRANASEGEAS